MNNFKIGDRVKVVRKVEKEEGWDDVWVDEMDACIGKTGIIEDILGKRILVIFPEIFGYYNFPPSSLELVKDA